MTNIVNEFLAYYMQKEPYASPQEITDILAQVELLVRKNKDKSLEELIDLIINDNINLFHMIQKKYGIPGYTIGIKVAGMNIKLYGGNINYLGDNMPINALFDIASMTKFYTQIIAYNLIREGLFSRNDKIIDLDNRFKNLGDLTVDDILTFATTFKTDGLVKDKKTVSEALDTILNANVVSKGKWNYNDIGLIIIKEVMEHLTGLTYPELVDKYIVHPLHLTDTHVIVPKSKYHLITATPNFKNAHINDMTANALGGYSGHAGIFSTSDDIIRLLINVRNKKIFPNIHDAYTPGKLNDAIAIMGNVYTANPRGLEKSFVSNFESRDTFAIAGSTRVNAASSSDSAYTVMLNPASISKEEAKEREIIINKERINKGLKPVNIIKDFEFNRDNNLERLTLIDSRYILPVDDSAELVSNVAKTTLKLRFLDFLIKKYDNTISKVNIIRNNK